MFRRTRMPLKPVLPVNNMPSSIKVNPLTDVVINYKSEKNRVRVYIRFKWESGIIFGIKMPSLTGTLIIIEGTSGHKIFEYIGARGVLWDISVKISSETARRIINTFEKPLTVEQEAEIIGLFK